MMMFTFRPEMPFSDKCGPKNQNCQLTLKFGMQTNSDMQKSIVISTFYVLDGKQHFVA